LPPASAVT